MFIIYFLREDLTEDYIALRNQTKRIMALLPTKVLVVLIILLSAFLDQTSTEEVSEV